MIKAALFILPFIRSLYLLKFPISLLIFIPILLNKIFTKKLTFLFLYLLSILYFYWGILTLFTPTNFEDNVIALLNSFFYALLGVLSFSNLNVLINNINKFFFLLFLILAISIAGYFIAVLNYENSLMLWLNSTSRSDLSNTWASFAFIDKDNVIPRLSGFFLDPNRWAAILFFFMVIILTLKNYLTKKQKNSIIVLILFSIILTQSRSVYLALISFIVFYSMLNFNIKILLRISTTIICIFIALSFLDIFIPLFTNDFLIQRFTSIDTDSENVRGRGQIIKFYLNYIFSNNLELFGNGFEFITDKYYVLGTHNTFNYIFFSSGIVGLSPILLIYSFLFTILFFKIKIEHIKVLLSALPSFIIIFLLEDYFFTPLFFGLLAYYFGIIFHEKNTNIHA